VKINRRPEDIVSVHAASDREIRQMNETHMFWAFGDISKLEIICLRSFLDRQYSLNLWTYGDIANAP
jgi:hypothetical protein